MPVQSTANTFCFQPPSGLPLQGTASRRARLRFTQRADTNQLARKEQEQRPGADHRDSLRPVYS